jgi:hypothetical protein
MSLRVVKPGTPAQQGKPVTVKSAAESGDRRALLTALRSRLAADIDNPNTPPRDLAALSRRLLEIARDLEMLAAAEKADDIGEAAATPDQDWASS